MAVEPLEPLVTEVPRTLDEAPPPRLLGLFDQFALWANLGISILLLVAAPFVVQPFGQPPLSLAAALVAILLGSVIGNALLGLAAVAGADTGAPGMVLLRGLLGWRGSWVPTALNVLQLVGWATFEIWIIAQTATQLTSDSLHWLWILLAGVLGTFMAVRPLGVVRGYLKKVATWAILASTVYLFAVVLTHDRAPLHGSWHAFWLAADTVIALPVSWIPLAADYTRHSRTPRDAFWGAFTGYGIASAAFFVLGVLAFTAYGGDDIIGSLLAVPAGGIALVILVMDELDEVFANVYSTVVSIQNVRPSLDRRVLAVALGAGCTVLAWVVHIEDYQNFLYLLGSVFVPLFGTFAAEYFLVRGRHWDVSEDARPRWEMLLPWAAGFVVYQLLNPGGISWWSSWWMHRQADLGFTPPSWASASLCSFLVAAALAVVVGRLSRSLRAGPSVATSP